MKEKIKNFVRNRLTATKNIEQNLKFFGGFLIFAYPGFYLINSLFVTPDGYENLPLRISIGLLGCILCLKDYWPQKCKPLLPAYMYFLLIYSLPFFFFFMLFHNSNSNLWQLNTLVGLFLLFLFVSYIDAIILSIIGYIAAYIVFIISVPEGKLPEDFFKLIIIYVSPLIYIALFSNQKELIQRAKLKSLQSLAGAIAHEMRTPLFNMIGKFKGLKGKIKLLIEDYRHHHGDEDPQGIGNLDVLTSLPDDLQKTTERSLNIIDIILTSLNTKFSEKEFQKCSILSIVEDALRDYPLTKAEKKLINFDKVIDFQIYGHPFLLKHVLFNLLKNALHYIKVAGKGQIYIWTEKTDTQYKLDFKDTGKGMPKEMVPQIFDDFFTKTDYGTGIGLSFCKKVMADMGGKIACDAVEGEFVQFILTFPPLK